MQVRDGEAKRLYFETSLKFSLQFGEDIKAEFLADEIIFSKERITQHLSEYHERGDVHLKLTTMNAAGFEANLRIISETLSSINSTASSRGLFESNFRLILHRATA
jgi:predicted DNA binding CopG/RHH family protein